MSMSTSDHYFAPQPASATSPTTHHVRVRKLELILAGDRGVFNQGDLDWGTRVLIENADVPTGGVLLDLGCGGGAIAVALAKLRPDAVIWAVDVNERALEVTRRSVELNALGNVRVASPSEVPSELQFDAIWSNPPIRVGKDELHRLLREWLARLTDGGTADLVVHKNLGSDSLAKWLANEGFSVDRRASKQGYRILHLVRA
ncbi:MAG: class I SAM-dependent methyltransferase [Actinomycetota bacterium]